MLRKKNYKVIFWFQNYSSYSHHALDSNTVGDGVSEEIQLIPNSSPTKKSWAVAPKTSGLTLSRIGLDLMCIEPFQKLSRSQIRNVDFESYHSLHLIFGDVLRNHSSSLSFPEERSVNRLQ